MSVDKKGYVAVSQVSLFYPCTMYNLKDVRITKFSFKHIAMATQSLIKCDRRGKMKQSIPSVALQIVLL